MEDLECPNCGGDDPQVISAGVFTCKFCGQSFVNERIREEQRAAARERADHELRVQRQQMLKEQGDKANAIGRRTMIIVAIFLIGVLALVGYMMKKSMDDAHKMQEDMQKEITKQFGQ